jgi:hypothetical protein
LRQICLFDAATSAFLLDLKKLSLQDATARRSARTAARGERIRTTEVRMHGHFQDK